MTEHKCSKCDKKFDRKSKVSEHLWFVHNVNNGNFKMHKCVECKKEYKSKSHLHQHLWLVHDVNKGNFKIHTCHICAKKHKMKYQLNQHLWYVHDINNGKFKTYCCNKCNYKCKSNSHLNQHKWSVHNINDGHRHTYNCVKCMYNCKSKNRLNQHLWFCHNINNGSFSTYKCDNCYYECKKNSYLNKHLECVHDIGNKKCNYCQGNCFILKQYKDKNSGQVKICRKCYKKVIGYKCRAEEDMVKFIENHKKLKDFVVSKDKIISNDSCNTKRRPDILLSSGDLHIIIECDEKQHRYYNPICESGRIDEILDEFKTGKVVFIRWNPDYYKVKKKLNRKERLEKLGKVIENLTNDPPKEHIKIIYMFYDQDNPVIVDRWNKEFVY